MGYIFQGVLHLNKVVDQPLGKRGLHSLNGLQGKNTEICKRPPRQWFLCGFFSNISHKSPPWKTGATQFEWITTSKLPDMHQTTKAMGFMRSLFQYYIQITSLENGDNTV